MSSATHGNLTVFHTVGDISPIVLEKSSTMAWALPPAASSDAPRPLLVSQQSNSLPSTPYQYTRGLSFHSRSPLPRRRSTSPHSTQSETNHLPSFRKPHSGCKYETGMAFFRRRMPYSLGGDLLPEEKDGLKEHLGLDEERKLNGDMGELYDRLLPSTESDGRRRQLVKKLERLFNSQWPGSDIRVHVFGSSGNKLCSSDSDVDICITTPFKELEQVCLLAEVLANHGMERVVCVSHAKVPIVKIWDPELKLACDMNVNNTLALENTRMIRIYVDIDERMRRLAMIVKYWTRRRVLNDAALGGTLSSYTWICLIINFLQTRDPPILPSLQARPHKKRLTTDGVLSSFDDDLDSLAGFGRENKQSLGELLFQFFRYYGYEVNYEKAVVSVREGKLISKETKGWHLLQNNRLCVEEPFNTSRNLGNTADDTSFRGVHIEIRRAFKAVAEADLEKCCEQYMFPAEEERSWEKPPPQPRPVIAPTSSHPSRGGRGGGRGARHSNQYGRGGNTARRSSGAANKTNNFRHNNVVLTHSELSFQAQQTYLLHDQLYQQIQILQAQEQELRMQLQNPALFGGRQPVPVFIRQPFIQFAVPQQEANVDEDSRSRAGTVSHPPLPAPIRQPIIFTTPNYLPVTMTGVQGSSTNPPSPSTAAAIPDLRRNHRRSSVANGSPGKSHRSHSQPARSLHAPAAQGPTSLYSPVHQVDSSQSIQQGPAVGSLRRAQNDNDTPYIPGSRTSIPRSAYVDENRPSEYIGYYLGGPPHFQSYQHLMATSPPTAAGLGIRSGAVSPFTQYLHDSRSPSLSLNETLGAQTESGLPSIPQNGSPPPRPAHRMPSYDRGPLIVDGSVPPTDRRNSIYGDRADQFASASHETSTSDEHNIDTPASTSDSLSMDMPEPISLELDNHKFCSQQNHEYLIHANASEPLLDGQHGRLGSLPGRLQTLYISSLERPEESTLRLEQEILEQAKTNHPSKGILDQDTSDSRLFACEQLTSSYSSFYVRDPLVEPPTLQRRPNGIDTDRPNGANHKVEPRTEQETSTISPSAAEKGDSRSDISPRKMADSTPSFGGREPGIVNTSSGWQTTRKKHKRNAKSTVETRPLNGVEPLPADESMRKGG